MPDKRAVVIVPGFPGSQLVDQGFELFAKDVWYSAVEYLVNGPDNLDLAANGIDPGPLASGPLTPSGPVDLGIYEPLMTQLANDGWQVDFHPWDWRRSFAVEGANFGRFLASKYAARDFWVVAHSAGGLLSRFAYSYFATTPAVARWRRTLYLGTPHGGSHWATCCLAGNWGDGAWTTMFGTAVANAFGPISRFPRLPASLQDRFLQVLASWPGLYDLFPSSYGQWAGLDPLAASAWNLSTWSSVNPHVTQARLTQGQAEVAALNALLAGPRPPEANIIGKSFSTPRAFINLADVALKKGYTYTTLGDGTVTNERAVLGDTGTATMGVGHNSLTQQGQVLSRITGWLLDGIPAPIIIPAPPIPTAPTLSVEGSTWVPPVPPPWKQVVGDP